MKIIKSIIGIAIVFALINGALWIFYSTTHGEEHEIVSELDEWFEEQDEILAELEDQAENAATEEDYNTIADEYYAIQDEYDENVTKYNDAIEVMNNEFYLIPIPLGKSSK